MVLANLERDGLVRRAAAGEDGRSRTVELTAAGRRLIAGLFPRHARLVGRALSVLTPAEQDELRRLCRIVGTGRREP
jgi:DNA-binding MarR family transcriptional regulator